MYPRLTETECKIIDDGRCPDCTFGELLQGPRAGFMVKVKCDRCGSTFNVATPKLAGMADKERISEPGQLSPVQISEGKRLLRSQDSVTSIVPDEPRRPDLGTSTIRISNGAFDTLKIIQAQKLCARDALVMAMTVLKCLRDKSDNPDFRRTVDQTAINVIKGWK
jgi:hypothetical protein